jgi:carboxyl-terminal processing protease
VTGVQTCALPIYRTSAVKLTTARYFTPSGRSIQAEGIKPDIVLGNVKLEAQKTAEVKPLKEADLSRHLGGGETSGAPAETTDKSGKSLVEQDFQLSEALNLLKGISIIKSQGKRT